MPFAYIGTLNNGGTCLMRGKTLQNLLPNSQAFFIETRQQVLFFNRIFQSIGFRFKRGPLIPKVNKHIRKQINTHNRYEFIWVDKAIYLTPKTTQILKRKTDCLIHYTPDTAFYANQSRFFYRSLKYYDYVITTKSFEFDDYLFYIPKEKLILSTQGYDIDIHKPNSSVEEKTFDLVFIGLWEPHREKIIQYLVDQNLTLILGGHKWEDFVKKNEHIRGIKYLGGSVRNEDYSHHISKALFGLGLISKKFPELHTTRTFEIPACGTALVTEKNNETHLFFTNEEAIFYSSTNELLEKINYYKNNPESLKILTEKGKKRVLQDGRDYVSILNTVLKKIGQ